MATMEHPGLKEFLGAEFDYDLAAAMGAPEARWLVDYYYSVQNFRIQADSLVRAIAQGADEGTFALGETLSKAMSAIESKIQKGLDHYSDAHTAGRWAKSIHGIGPVIAAGLLAHIDITKAPTVGHIYRFAGLDPSVQWLGRTASKEVVDAAFKTEPTQEAALVWLSKAVSRYPTKLYEMAGVDLPDRDEARDVISGLFSVEQITDAFERHPIEIGAAIRHLADSDDDFEEPDVYAQLLPDAKVSPANLAKALGKRPWNADLKVLCWKIGDSFVRLRTSDNDVYGKVYDARKEQEVEKNERRDFADQAKQSLETRNIKNVDTRAAYEDGKLPPGRIDLRARRYAVKMFLSHYHHVLYEDHHGTPPPRPYAIEHLGHVDYVPPPNWPMGE